MSVGEKNAYYCSKCFGYTITIDVDNGVTPMFLGCRATGKLDDCEGIARSMMYPPQPWPGRDDNGRTIPTEPQFEWYRPKKFRRSMSAESLSHVRQGGLLIRPYRGESNAVK